MISAPKVGLDSKTTAFQCQDTLTAGQMPMDVCSGEPWGVRSAMWLTKYVAEQLSEDTWDE